MFTLFVLLLSAAAAEPDPATMYRVGAAKGPYFLCDERVVEDRWLAERFVAPPQRHAKNPLIVQEHAWEGSGPHMGGTVLHDPEDGLFKIWYSVFNRDAYENNKPFSYNVCYAESDDGLVWRKPELGVFDFGGNTANNLIKLGTDKTQNIDVCLNPKPEVWPGKFLSIHNQKGGIFVSHSEDGKSFTRLFPDPIVSYHSDTHNNFVYDEIRERWHLFCRPRAYAGYHKRRVATQQSADLQHWPHERTILVPEETGAPEFYGMQVHRRGDLFFGFLQQYDRDSAVLRVELLWSGDGEHWSDIPTHPLFAGAGEPGTWDGGMVALAETPVERGDEVWYYYGGWARTHDNMDNTCGIGVMVGERDRLIGLRDTTDAPGTILTRPLLVEGRELVVNARIQGRLTAELRTDGNKVIKGFAFEDSDPVSSSGFSQPVTWQGKQLSQVEAEEVRVLFKLEKAELFTYDLVRP